jgi:2-polyprenyl-6-methoxyphenol hydroxylase-like FAD-dependent oxidoreductase
VYREWFDPLRALIEATLIEPETTLTYDRAPRREWGRGRATLLGDAAHPMKPNIGQGAAQALVDAVVLGECFRGAAYPEVALREYERRRIKYANAVVRASRQAGSVAEIRNPIAARIRNVVLRALPDGLTIAQQRRLLRPDV